MDILYFLLSLLIVRLFLLWNDTPAGIGRNLVMLGAELLLCLPLFPARLPGILIFLILYHPAVYLTEKYTRRIYLTRFIHFALLILSSGFLFSRDGDTFNHVIVTLMTTIRSSNYLFSRLRPDQIRNTLLVSVGAVTIMNELNNLIRLILKSLKVVPVKKEPVSLQAEAGPQVIDLKELNRGKIIGILERLLIFFFTVTGHYSSIGFILAAKGFTRFRDLDDHDFAEYVLIGTLLSSSLSIFTGFLFSRWL